jgi:hypothetical protein
VPPAPRGRLLTTAAVLFALLGVSDLVKPLQLLGDRTGMVLFGRRLAGTANAVWGPLFGVFLLAYATAIWRMRRAALHMGRAYAAYVLVNLALFPFRTPAPPDAGMGERVFGLVYAVFAIGVSAGTAVALGRRQADLT